MAVLSADERRDVLRAPRVHGLNEPTVPISRTLVSHARRSGRRYERVPVGGHSMSGGVAVLDEVRT